MNTVADKSKLPLLATNSQPAYSNSEMTASNKNSGTPRLLVVIASFGEKNIECLKTIIRAYHSLPMDMDVVVTSDAPKDLGTGARVVVGLPTEDPWSLPFAHKTIFAQNLESYDLFIYSEDDMAVTEKNIQAFLQITPQLQPDEIAGFLRYELDGSGKMSLPDVHGVYHWKPESVRRRGNRTVAEFTNEHAAVYILTQAQLKQAIASGGFLHEPCEGRHDMACTAATDPYTSCGFRKVVCISELDEFLLHHMPNRYVGHLGISLPAFKEQVQTLLDIGSGTHSVKTLCEVESKLLRGRSSKDYYEKPCDEVLGMIPRTAKTILSVGCGWGAMEARLKERGVMVTALPLDSVIGAAAARSGIEVVYGTMSESFEKLQGRKFDCVVILNLLHLQSDSGHIVDQCCQFVAEKGTLVVSGPNFQSIPVLLKRVLNKKDFRKLRSFEESGVDIHAMAKAVKRIKRAGLNLAAVKWFNSTAPQKMAGLRRRLGRFMSEAWVIQAQRGNQ